MNHTPRFGLTTLDNSTDQLDANDNKFGDADRVLLDQLLAYAIEHHVHTGEVLAQVAPAAPAAYSQTSGGVLPPNATLYYRTAFVDDRGQFEMASQVATVHTAPQVATPNPPTITRTTGALAGGNYAYAVSAVTEAINQETLPSTIVTGVLNGAEGGWQITLPAVPSGATGFNIYRRAPGDNDLVYLFSVASATTSVVDDGSDVPDIRHGLPTRNTTRSANAVNIEWDPPAGATTRIYRTTNPTNWSTSLVDWVGGTSYFDTGRATRSGFPPAQSSGIGGAPKIRLGVDTEGVLPSAVNVTTQEVLLEIPGPVTEGAKSVLWVNEFAGAQLKSYRPHLDIGSVPDAQNVLVTIERQRPGDGVWFQIVSWAAIVVGETIGESITIDNSNSGSYNPRVLPGEVMRVSVEQAGGGAGTDTGLVVAVQLAVSHVIDEMNPLNSYTWETT